MSDTNLANPQMPAAGAAGQAPRLGAMSRFLKVFFSPGEVFDDVRRSPSGWWAPILICAALTAIFGSLYVTRYDMASVLREQLKDHWSMKLVSSMQGPAARDKALDIAVKQVGSTPVWQMAVSQWSQSFMGWSLAVWFFTFLYGLIALMMGWLGEVRAPKLFISLGIVLGVGVLTIVIGGVLQFAGSAAKNAAIKSGGDIPPTPTWVALAGVVITLAAAAGFLFATARLARETALARLIGAVAYGLAPAAVGALIGAIIVLIRTPDVTSFEDLVPANLTLLLNLKQVNPALASLGTSLGLFSIWSAVLTVIGVAKALGRTIGEAAGIVLVPWIVWILVKVAFAAIAG
jgi:hypothetical protein